MLRPLAILYLFSIFSVTGLAQKAPLWGNLTPGSYQVGYHLQYLKDESRTYTNQKDIPGSLKNADNRLLEVRIWYPAQVPSKTKPTTYQDYLYASLNHPAPVIKQLTGRSISVAQSISGRDPGRFKKLLQTPMYGQKNAVPLAGKFPVVLYSFGMTDGWDENIVLWEYLASQGFVVVVSPSLGMHSITLSFDQPSLETAIRDMEFLIAFSKGLSYTDPSRMAAVGFSFGGMAALGLGMRNTDIDVIVGIDPSFSHKQYQYTLLNSPFFNPRITTPLLHIYNDYKDVDLRLADSLKFSTQTRIGIGNNAMNHIDFVSYTKSMTYTLPDSMQQKRKVKSSGYEFVCRATAAFLNQTFKAGPSPDYNVFATPDLIKHIAITHKKALPPPVSRQQLEDALFSDPAKAITLVQEMKLTDTSNILLSISELMSVSYAVFSTGEYANAITFMEYLISIYPDSPTLYDYLGEAFYRQGSKEKAIVTYEKLLTLVAANQEMKQEEKEQLIQETKARLLLLKQK